MDILSPWSVQIFDGFNAKLDGGIFRALANINTTQGVFIPPNFIGSWVADLVDNYHYNVLLGIAILWAILIPLFGVALLCRFCIRRSKRCGRCGTHECTCKCKRTGSDCSDICHRKRNLKNHSRSGKIIVVTCAAVLLLFILFILLHFPIYGSARLQGYLLDSDTTLSLNSTIQSALLYTKLFLTDGVASANTTSLVIVDELRRKIVLILNDLATSFLQKVLLVIGVTPAFSRAEEVLNDLINMTTAMSTIHKTRGPLFKDISEFRGAVKAYKPLIRNTFLGLCEDGVAKFRQNCLQLQRETELLENNLQESDIYFDSSTATITFMNVSKISIITIRDDFLRSRQQLSAMSDKLKEELTSKIPLDYIHTSLASIWTSFAVELNKSVIKPLNDLQSTNPLQNIAIQTYFIWSHIFGTAWSLLLIYSVIIALLLILIILRIIWAKRKQKKEKNLQLSNLNYLYFFNDNDRYDIIHSATKYLLKIAICFHSAWGIIMVLSFLTGTVLLFLSGVYSSETCRYLVEPKNVLVADPLTDAIVKREWDRMVSTVNLSQIVIPVQLKSPKQLLKTLYFCDNVSVPLLPALGMSGMLNFSQLTNLPQYTSLVNVGRDLITKNLETLNLGSLMNTKIVTDLESAVTFLEVFAKKTNYSPSIAALQKPLFKLRDYDDYVVRLDGFYLSYRSSHSQVSDFDAVVAGLQKRQPFHMELRKRLQHLSSQFSQLQELANLTSDMKSLLSLIKTTMSQMKNIEFLKKNINDVYSNATQPLADKLIQTADESFKKLESSIFMCHNLHLAYFHMTWGLCGRFRTDLNFVAIHFFICLVWVQALYLVVSTLLYYLEKL